MSFRRRRSGDFTSSLIEYNRQAEENNFDNEDVCQFNGNKLELKKKKMVIVKSNETISVDTTIFNQVSTLRTQLKTQKQICVQKFRTCRTPEKHERTGTTVSPITDVLNKISKTLELKQEKENSKPAVEVCQEPSKLWSALSNFNRSLNSDKNGVQSHQKVLSRLSQEFHQSPTKFTEKLVTIIEESVMPSISDQKDYSGVSVRRMTQEFRKLCKFIEDESMPELLLTPDAIEEEQTEQIENQTIDFVDETTLGHFETFASTPINDKELAKDPEDSLTETPKGIFKCDDVPLNTCKKPFNAIIKEGRLNDTNNSFENWENMCNGVYLHQRVTPKKLRRSLSLPESPVTRLNNIKSTCERQMASLDDTAINENRIVHKPRNFRELTKGLTCSPQKLIVAKVKTPTNKKYFPEKVEDRDDTKKVATQKQKRVLSKAETNRYTLPCEDDLDKSLLAELAQRRQRCFETAKLMMEIDKHDPAASIVEGQKTAELLAKLGSPNKSLSLPANNLDFLNTINHCMEYQDFLLKKKKPIFNILKNPASTDAAESKKPENLLKPNSVELKKSESAFKPNSVELKKVESPFKQNTVELKKPESPFKPNSVELKKPESPFKLNSVEMKKRESPFKPNNAESKKFESPFKPKTPVKKVQSAEKTVKTSPKRRFFVTPGKSPKALETKKKKEYFPQMENIINVQSTVNMAKSPRTPEVRKNIYEYVKSPIAEYIKGTDTKLVKNIHAKNNDWLLTPQPLGVSNESKGNRITPVRNIQEFSALKFNLSPAPKKDSKYRSQTDENNPVKEFMFPKVDYKPSSVQMVNEDSDNDVKSSGMRLKNLLKSSERKVVIRHEGRMGVPSPRKSDKEGLDDTIMEASICVKTVARKTDSIRTRNVR